MHFFLALGSYILQVSRREVNKAVNLQQYVHLQVQPRYGGLSSADFLSSFLTSVILVGVVRRYNESDDTKSSNLATRMDHVSVGALASTNSLYFLLLALIWAIKPNM